MTIPMRRSLSTLNDDRTGFYSMADGQSLEGARDHVDPLVLLSRIHLRINLPSGVKHACCRASTSNLHRVRSASPLNNHQSSPEQNYGHVGHEPRKAGVAQEESTGSGMLP